VFDNNDWSSGFAVATGSITGREHTRVHRNNQDGLAVRVEGQRIVAALCDGCSAGRSSEVGARLAAAWIVANLPRLSCEPTLAARIGERSESLPRGGAERLARSIEEELLAYLRQIAAGEGAQFIHDHLLFTILCAIIEPERTLILGLGDGLYSVDGRTNWIDPGADNAPPYLAYRLVDPLLLDRPSLEPLRVLHEAPSCDSLVLASDGAASLVLSEDDPRWAKNPSLLQKRLNVLEPKLSDDASVIWIRRRAS
jgi:serine/threonine protein phosphatase PrpC